MRAVSRDQATNLIGRIATTINFGPLDSQFVQKAIIEGLDDEEFGDNVTSFLKNGAKRVIALPKSLDINHHLRPENVDQVSQLWKGPFPSDGTRGNVVDHLPDLQSLEFSRVAFSRPKGSQLAAGHIYQELVGQVPLLGFRVGMALMRDYKERGKDSALEWYRATYDIRDMTFMGTVLRRPSDGYPFFYGLQHINSVWDWGSVGLWDLTFSEQEAIPIYVP